jgi:hypothetical protein
MGRNMGMVKLGCLAVIGLVSLTAQDKAIDSERSTITVHVSKAGLLSMAGHEHWVNAPISAGVLDDSNRPHVEFRVDAGKMVVKPDPKIDGKTQAQIQKDMQDITLESARYPEIAFLSEQSRKFRFRQSRKFRFRHGRQSAGCCHSLIPECVSPASRPGPVRAAPGLRAEGQP